MEFPVMGQPAASTAPSLTERVARMVSALQPGARMVEIADLKRLTGGNARQAWAFTASWSGPATGRQHHKRCVMLCKAGAGQLQADLGREFRILAALQRVGLPSPQVLWLDEHGDYLGMPGFVMERGDGEAGIRPLLNPIDPGMTRSLTEQLIRIGAALHDVDWQKAGLDFLAEGDPALAPAQELVRWETQYLQNRMEPLPVLSSVFEWLRHQLPAPERLSLVHGDFRLGNFLYREGRIELLLDWEMAHLGNPFEDLAWIYRPLWSPQAFLPLDEAVALYESATGRAIRPKDMLYHRIFSEAKFSVISLTAARSYDDSRTENLQLAGRMFRVSECLELCLQWIDQWEAS
jgi:aminoglycoside phosphotransferase (APT) family kinase protein